HYIAKAKDKRLDAYFVTLYEGDPLTQVDAMLLHSAVTAKARGYSGFSFMMVPTRPSVGWVRFGKPGDPGIDPDLYLDADATIADLKAVIPPPEEVETRRRLREQAPKQTAAAS